MRNTYIRLCKQSFDRVELINTAAHPYGILKALLTSTICALPSSTIERLDINRLDPDHLNPIIDDVVFRIITASGILEKWGEFQALRIDDGLPSAPETYVLLHDLWREDYIYVCGLRGLVPVPSEWGYFPEPPFAEP